MIDHKTRMERKKTVIDANIAAAQEERGVVVLLTGNGKGKSSSAFGMVGRTLGIGKKAGVVQFLKSRTDTGEEAFYGKYEGCEWAVTGGGFTWDTQDREADIAQAEEGWAIAERLLADPDVYLVVLDELTYLLSYKYLDAGKVLGAIRNRPKEQSVVITGRGASKELRELADTLSELTDVKHAYRAGVKARPGIDL